MECCICQGQRAQEFEIGPPHVHAVAVHADRDGIFGPLLETRDLPICDICVVEDGVLIRDEKTGEEWGCILSPK